MQDWSTPLVVATAAFLVLVLWRVRPVLPWGKRGRPAREAIRLAKARARDAKDDGARAIALCDAADIMAKTVAGKSSAKGLYLRAMRTDPTSVAVVQRARAGLASRPRALESLMWRHLAGTAWTGPGAGATQAALEALGDLYRGPLRSAIRARALANARDALRA